MPELPEVEIAARNLRAWAIGRRVVRAEADDGARRIFRPERPRAFTAAVAGLRIGDVRRIGKQLLIRLDGRRPGALGVVSHLGMTGKWLRRLPGEAPPSHSRARLALEDGQTLHYRDPRLFGRLRLEDGIDEGRLAEALARRSIPIKIALLDQALLPGVGNILASEALFRARIDPRRKANALTRPEVKRLRVAVLAAIEDTLARESGPEPRYVEEPGSENPFLVYARAGETCPRCRKGRIARLVQAQRSTFYCPRCQR